MRGYKTFDAIAQTVLILILAAGFIAGTESMSPLSFLIGLGLLQIISLVVHAVNRPLSWKATTLRKIHLVATGLVFVVIIIGFIQDATSVRDKHEMPGLGTIVWAGVLAVAVILFYTAITWIEWWRMRKAG